MRHWKYAEFCELSLNVRFQGFMASEIIEISGDHACENGGMIRYFGESLPFSPWVMSGMTAHAFLPMAGIQCSVSFSTRRPIRTVSSESGILSFPSWLSSHCLAWMNFWSQSVLLNLDIQAAGSWWSILQLLLNGPALVEYIGDWVPGLLFSTWKIRSVELREQCSTFLWRQQRKYGRKPAVS